MKTIVLMVVALLAATSGAYADLMTISAASEAKRSASALFSWENGGNMLTIVLNNTSPFDALGPRDILTAFFFDINPSLGTLTPFSAIAEGDIFFGPGDYGNVGGEWAYGSWPKPSDAPRSAGMGISCVEFNLFYEGNFNGPPLWWPSGIESIDYGITSAGDNMRTGSLDVTDFWTLIRGPIRFQLISEHPISVPAAEIVDNWTFVYGPDLYGFNLSQPVPIPAPGAALLGVIGLSLVAWMKRHLS